MWRLSTWEIVGPYYEKLIDQSYLFACLSSHKYFLLIIYFNYFIIYSYFVQRVTCEPAGKKGQVAGCWDEFVKMIHIF